MGEGSSLKIDLNIYSISRERLASPKCNQQKTFVRKPTFDYFYFCRCGTCVCVCVFTCVWMSSVFFLNCFLPYTVRQGLSFRLEFMGALVQLASLFQEFPASAFQVLDLRRALCSPHRGCGAKACSSLLNNESFAHRVVSPVTDLLSPHSLATLQ